MEAMARRASTRSWPSRTNHASKSSLNIVCHFFRSKTLNPFMGPL